MKFEIINPSDPYVLEADDLKIAAVAICLLGDGRYSLKGIDTEQSVPFFLFGGHDEWFTARFGHNFEAAVADACASHSQSLAKCLDSVTLLSGERSSLNDIGGRAKRLAVAVRDKARGGAHG